MRLYKYEFQYQKLFVLWYTSSDMENMMAHFTSYVATNNYDD